MARKKNVATEEEEYNIPDAPLDPIAEGIVVPVEASEAKEDKKKED